MRKSSINFDFNSSHDEDNEVAQFGGVGAAAAQNLPQASSMIHIRHGTIVGTDATRSNLAVARNNEEIGRYDSFFADWNMPEVLGAGLEEAFSPEGGAESRSLPKSELEELKGIVNEE